MPNAGIQSLFKLAATAGLFAALLTPPSAPAHAQLPSNAYVPIEHWTMPYLEHLVRRKVIPDPDPTVRPFTVARLLDSFARVDSSRASNGDLALIERIRDDFYQPDDWVGLTFEVDAGLRTATHARRNSNLRESGDEDFLPRAGASVALQAGWAGLIMHPEYDPNIENDPDYGGADVYAKATYPEAYLAFRSRYVDLDFGRLRRNWGPIGVRGLAVSAVPYSYDHLFFEIGTERFSWKMLLANLDSITNSNGEQSDRYLATHRIEARPVDFLDLAFFGGQLVAAPGQHWEFWFMNPIPYQSQSRDEQGKKSNLLLGGDGEMRLGDFRLAGALTFDDAQIVPGPAKNDEPASFALSAVADYAAGPATVSAYYTLVSNLSYRTHDPAEAYLIDQNLDRFRPGTGLAHNFSDFDVATLKAGILLRQCLLLTPEVTYLRQGEGDIRQPFPPNEEYANLKTVLNGTVEKTWRLALQGEFAHPIGINLSFDAGFHFISDWGNVAGTSTTKFVGVAHLRYIIGTKLRLE